MTAATVTAPAGSGDDETAADVRLCANRACRKELLRKRSESAKEFAKRVYCDRECWRTARGPVAASPSVTQRSTVLSALAAMVAEPTPVDLLRHEQPGRCRGETTGFDLVADTRFDEDVLRATAFRFCADCPAMASCRRQAVEDPYATGLYGGAVFYETCGERLVLDLFAEEKAA